MITIWMTSLARSNKNRATAQDQNLLFDEIDYKVIDQLNIGTGVQLRLVTPLNSNGQRQYIQLYSNVTKQWSMMYRYNIEEAWRLWKQTCQRIQLRTQKKTKSGTSSAPGTNSKKSSTKTKTGNKN